MTEKNFFEMCDKAKELYSFWDINTSDEYEVGVIITGLQNIQNDLVKYRTAKEEEKKKEDYYNLIIQ